MIRHSDKIDNKKNDFDTSNIKFRIYKNAFDTRGRGLSFAAFRRLPLREKRRVLKAHQNSLKAHQNQKILSDALEVLRW